MSLSNSAETPREEEVQIKRTASYDQLNLFEERIYKSAESESDSDYSMTKQGQKWHAGALKRTPSLNSTSQFTRPILNREFSRSSIISKSESKITKGSPPPSPPSPRHRIRNEDNKANLMNKILRSVSESNLYQTFLCTRHSEENLLFWKDVESYHELCTKLERGVLPSKKDKNLSTKKAAKQIWETYLADNAKLKINVDQSFITKIKEDIAMDLRITTFDAAQESVFNLMRDDMLPKYLASEFNKETELNEKPEKEKKIKSGYTLETQVHVKDNLNLGVGTIKFIGCIENDNSTSVGLMFDSPVGNCEGKVAGVEYFECPKNYGLFVSIDQIEKVSKDGVKGMIKRTFTNRNLAPNAKRSSLENDALTAYARELLSPSSTNDSLEACRREILSLSFQSSSLSLFISILNQQKNNEEHSNSILKKWLDRNSHKASSSFERDFIEKVEKKTNSSDKISVGVDAFELLVNFVQSALVHVKFTQDYDVARELLFTSSKYCMHDKVSGSMVFVLGRLKNVAVWKELLFWEDYLPEKTIEKLKAHKLQSIGLVMIGCEISYFDVHGYVMKHSQHLQPEDISQLITNLNNLSTSFTSERQHPDFDLYNWIQLHGSK